MHARIPSFIVTAAVLLIPVSAAAQDIRPGQAYRGLFGPNTLTSAESFTVNGQLGAGWDSNLYLAHREEGFVLGRPTSSRSEGVYNLFSGGIAYARRGDKLQFNASEASSARRYPDYPLLASHDGAARIGWTPSKKIQLSTSHEFLYQPWQTLASFPALFEMPLRFDAALAPNQSYASVGGTYRSYITNSSVTTQLSRQSSLTAGYSYQLSTYDNSAAFFGPFEWNVFATAHDRLTNQSGLVRFNHGLTRHLGWHAGYGYSEVRYSNAGQRYVGHTFDMGVDYARQLSVTRRTTLSFTTGAIALEQADQTHYRRYDATALATLAREIGRTWNASVSYVRSVEYFDRARLPYFYDGVILQLAGLISRRTAFHSAAGATYGDLGISRVRDRRDRFTTGYGNTGVGFAFSRYLSINTDYIFYVYSLNQLGTFAPGAAPELHRHDVVLYLSAWAPLFERGRKTNAPR